MDESEAKELRKKVKGAFPSLTVDIHWEKPAGMTTAFHELVVSKQGKEKTIRISSQSDYTQKISDLRNLAS